MARDLLTRSKEFVGLDQKFWLLLETAGFGDAATNAPGVPTSGGIGHMSGMIDFKIAREDSKYRSARSVVTRLSGKKEVKWNMESYIVPGAPDMSSNPTLPDAHPMLLGCFGQVDLTDPTQIQYQLVRNSASSFRLLEEGSHFSRVAVGCVCDSVTFSLPGDGKASMKFDGFAQDVYMAGETALTSAADGSAHRAGVTLQDLTFAAVATGQAGNAISIAYTTGATAGAEVVTVTGSAISIQIQTGVSTATQVKAAFDAATPATALATSSISGTGSNAQVTASIHLFIGGRGVNDIAVTAGQGGRYDVNCWIDLIDQTDGNTSKATTPRQVTAVTGDLLTYSGSAIATGAVGDIVIGYTPPFTAQGAENALLGLRGSFTTANFGSVDCQLLKAEISLKNNFTDKKQYYGTSKICGFIADKRRAVAIKMDVLLTKDNFEFYTKNKSFVADNLTIVLEPQDIPSPINAAQGRTLTFNMPKVEFNVPNLEQPADGFIKLSLEGICLAQDIDNTNTELTLTIT